MDLCTKPSLMKDFLDADDADKRGFILSKNPRHPRKSASKIYCKATLILFIKSFALLINDVT